MSKIIQKCGYSSPKLSLIFLFTFTIMGINGSKTFTPKTSPELKIALSQAQPGDVITLLPIAYEGKFILSQGQGQTESQDVGQPSSNFSTATATTITLQGTQSHDFRNHSTIVPPVNGTAITITGNFPVWNVTSLGINCPSGGSGVVVLGNGHTLKSLVINMDGDGVGVILIGNKNIFNATTISYAGQGVVINGSGNSMQAISMNGLTDSGITVERGSKGTQIRAVSTYMDNFHGRSLILKEGSMGSLVDSVTFNGISTLGGNDGTFTSTVLNEVNMLGCGNEFFGTIISTMYQKKSENGCNNFFHQSTMIGGWSDEPLE